jgi:hypothetical protein
MARPYGRQELPPGTFVAVDHAVVEIVALSDRALFQLPVDLIGLGKRGRVFHVLSQTGFRVVGPGVVSARR